MMMMNCLVEIASPVESSISFELTHSWSSTNRELVGYIMRILRDHWLPTCSPHCVPDDKARERERESLFSIALFTVCTHLSLCINKWREWYQINFSFLVMLHWDWVPKLIFLILSSAQLCPIIIKWVSVLVWSSLCLHHHLISITWWWSDHSGRWTIIGSQTYAP